MRPPLLLLVTTLCGCAVADGRLDAYWGPVTAGGQETFATGQPMPAQGFVARRAEDGRDVLHLAFVESDAPATCDAYTVWLRAVDAANAQLAEVRTADGVPVEWREYLCQSLDGAAREAFGGAGRFRALHLLAEVSGGGPDSGFFRVAVPPGDGTRWLGASILQPGRVVSRLVERSRHGDGLLPEDEAAAAQADIDPPSVCSRVIDQLLAEAEGAPPVYPDAAAVMLAASTHRYYLSDRDQQSVPTPGGGSQSVGLAFPDWAAALADGGLVEIATFLSVARAANDFPYDELLLSSGRSPTPVEPCPGLVAGVATVWPDLPGGT